jgi:hypothetical protein
MIIIGEITATDVMGSNGVIHVINAGGKMPKSNFACCFIIKK